MTCPKCEQRAKDERQALSQCEKQQQQAVKVNQRMAIAVAVLSTLTGNLAGQQKAVTDYVLSSGRGKFTVNALTEAPANGDTFILV